MLRLAHRLLQAYSDVMVLADRGLANHDLLEGLHESRWHYALRLPSDVIVHGPRRYPVDVGTLWPPKGEARSPLAQGGGQQRESVQIFV